MKVCSVAEVNLLGLIAKQRAEGEFNQLLEEYGKIRSDSHWYDVKKDLEEDSRYNRGVLSPDDREDLFRAFRRKIEKEEETKRKKKELYAKFFEF